MDKRVRTRPLHWRPNARVSNWVVGQGEADDRVNDIVIGIAGARCAANGSKHQLQLIEANLIRERARVRVRVRVRVRGLC